MGILSHNRTVALVRTGSRATTSMAQHASDIDIENISGALNTVLADSSPIVARPAPGPIPVTRYDFLNITLTAQNEFYGDQLDKVVMLAPMDQWSSMRVLLRNTNVAAASTDFYLEYYDGAAWQLTAVHLSANSTPVTMVDSGWVVVSAGMLAMTECFVRLNRTPYDAGTDIPSAQLIFRRVQI